MNDSSTVKMRHFKDAQRMSIASMNLDGIDAFLEDFVTSDDPNSPITGGFFKLEVSNPLEYTYSYDEVKIMLEGEMTLSDGSSSVTLKPGDAIFLPKGVAITFTTESNALAFYCGQRKFGEL